MKGRKNRSAADVELARATALARLRGEAVPNPPVRVDTRTHANTPWKGQLSAYSAIKRGAGIRREG